MYGQPPRLSAESQPGSLRHAELSTIGKPCETLKRETLKLFLCASSRPHRQIPHLG